MTYNSDAVYISIFSSCRQYLLFLCFFYFCMTVLYKLHYLLTKYCILSLSAILKRIAFLLAITRKKEAYRLPQNTKELHYVY